MHPDSRSHSGQDLFLDALHSEIIAGSENLASWIRQIQAQGAIDSIFGLEVWLKGLRSFFNADHLPLSDREKSELATRSFASEIEVVREAIQICEAYACEVMIPDISGKLEFEEFIEIQMRRDRMLDSNISRVVQQLTPRDSVSQLSESLNDLRIMIDAFKFKNILNYQLFMSLGRCFSRELKNCRYIDMLMGQSLRLPYGLIENKSLAGVLRRISEDALRRNLSSALLYLFRFLKCLKFVSLDLKQDRPLKRNLVIFSLLHEEMGNFSDLLKTRISRNREVGHAVRNAAELIAYSMKTESQRVLNRELILVSREVDPATVYARIENGHGLLRNCCQSCILTLIDSIDKNFDTTALFPSRMERLITAEKLRKDLWDLRLWLTDILSNKEELDSNKIIVRIAAFKDASLHSLMYGDWAEFDAFLDAVAISANFIEIRTHIRKFAGFLEMLIQEVSKRTVFQEKQPAS
jgi:hypothetical protein